MQINWSIYQNDINEIKRLWEAAHLDSLTRLYNRYGMETWITQQLEQKSADDQAAMLVLDVDNFKYVNDTFGHMLGDALLVDIANIIRSLFSEDFFCGRIGGDEYQIFALNISKEEVCRRTEMLCRQIKEKYEKEHQDYNISISVGIALSDDNRGQNYADLYKMADLALYQAKSEGKNGYILFGESAPRTHTHEDHRCIQQPVVQLGESGFSTTKMLLDSVIDELAKKASPQITIENISRLIVDTFDVSRAYASCYMPDEQHIGKSFFYAQNDDHNITPNLAMSARDYEKKCFNSDGIFFCTNIEDSVEPVKTELKRMKVQTLLQILIYKDGKIIGTLGINNCGYKRLWLQSEIEVMHTISKLMVDTIYQLQQESVADEHYK